MSAAVLTIYVLTALAVVDVALTRLRFRGGRVSGRLQVAPGILNVHTFGGTLAIVLWVVFLVTGRGEKDGNALLGVLALGLFWITTVAGLMILMRWRRSRGKRARDELVVDSWGRTPLLSVIAHVGMLLGVLVLSYAYLDRWV